MTDAGQIHQGLRRLIEVRGCTSQFTGVHLLPFVTHNPHVLGEQRPGAEGNVLVLANFSDGQAPVSAETLSGMPDRTTDLVTGLVATLSNGVTP